MLRVGLALGKSLDEVGRLGFAELVLWRTALDDAEERSIAAQAAAIKRFWTGETAWAAEHFLRPPEPRWISDPQQIKDRLFAFARAFKRAKKGRKHESPKQDREDPIDPGIDGARPDAARHDATRLGEAPPPTGARKDV